MKFETAFFIKGDICGSGVKYPLIGAIREELLGMPRDVIAPGIEPADIDWETVSTALAPVQATTLPPATRIDINSVILNQRNIFWYMQVKLAIIFRTTLVSTFYLIAFKGGTTGHQNSSSSSTYRATITK